MIKNNPDYRIIELIYYMFLHKSRNFINLLWIKWPYTACTFDTMQKFCSNFSLSNYWKETKLFDLVTGTATKRRLSGNMLPNINTCENGCTNFSASLRLVTTKLIDLTQFVNPIELTQAEMKLYSLRSWKFYSNDIGEVLT